MFVQCPGCSAAVELAPGRASSDCPHCATPLPPDRPPTVAYADGAPSPSPRSDNTATPGPSAPSSPAAGASRSSTPAETHAAGRRFEPGVRIGPYRILEFLGAGGMGAVYKAEQTSLNRIVALKVLPAGLAAEPEFVERFRREGMALANLSHSHIVGIHDLAEVEGIPFFVMEYVAGTSLRRHLAEKRPAWRESLPLLLPVCDALEYAHAQGVIHRDIKPENVLLDESGRVKIADFGLARLVGGLAPPSLTMTNVILGTPEYMAPEQRTNARRVDHRADLYSVGVMVYELATGDLPLGRFPLPSEFAGVDARLDRVVVRALDPDPNRRYASARELRADIAALVGDDALVLSVPASVAPAGLLARTVPSPPALPAPPVVPASAVVTQPTSSRASPQAPDLFSDAMRSAGRTITGGLGIVFPMLFMLSIFDWDRRYLMLLGTMTVFALVGWAAIPPSLAYLLRRRELDVELERLRAGSEGGVGALPPHRDPSTAGSQDRVRLSGGR